MSSEDRVPWEESNLGLIGSDLDKKIKEAAAGHEEAWGEVGDSECLKVWRIEQFQVKEWPTSKYGQFHVGDSYIVLKSTLENDKLLHDVHFWIGSESSQDEYGTAAYKTVECDDKLGGIAVQHREIQGHESDLFKSYFDGRLMYLAGGVASGFRHVEPTPEQPHLYRVKGTEKAMSLTQMPELSTSSLNTGDSFILVLGKDKVILWNGAKSNPDERTRANSVAESMATEGSVTVLDQGEGDADCAEFWDALGGYTDKIIEGSQEEDEFVEEFTPTLYKLSPGSAPEQIAEGELTKIGWGKPTPKLARDLLDDADVFLLDGGWELFVWMGKSADRNEKLAAMDSVDKYGKTYGRARHLPVSIMKAGYETSAFNGYFVV